MPKYLINFTATIDGTLTEYGMIRVSGAYNPNVTKKAIEKHYRKKHLDKNHIAVVITAKIKVSNEDYDNAASSSIDVT